jgi:hypothetical protein
MPGRGEEPYSRTATTPGLGSAQREAIGRLWDELYQPQVYSKRAKSWVKLG